MSDLVEKYMGEGPAIDARKREFEKSKKLTLNFGKKGLKKMYKDIKSIEKWLGQIDKATNDVELDELRYEISRITGLD